MGPNLVCLLPKGASEDPADRRPIILLSIFYRIWAAARSGEVREWLQSNGVLQKGDGCGPNAKAGDLALHMARACLTGTHVAGLALDWSKRYDRLPLAMLEQVAQAAGIPAEISGPMLASYRRKRCVRAGLRQGARAPPIGLLCWLTAGWLAWSWELTTPKAGIVWTT